MKYEFTGEEKTVANMTLKRIRSLVTIVGVVTSGDCGGWVEYDHNLDQDGDAWVYGDTEVFGNAMVYGNAKVFGNAMVSIAPVVITGLDYTLTVSDNMLAVGCQCWTFQEWRDKTPEEIIGMDGKKATAFYPTLISLLDFLKK